MKAAFIVAKLAVSAALVTFIAHTFDLRGIGSYLSQIDAATAALTIVTALSVTPLQTWRWMIVLTANGNRLPFGRALRIVLIGHFFSQTLPSAAGGDAMRIWCTYRAGIPAGDAAATVVLDRALSLVGLLVLTGVTLPWLFGIVPDRAASSAVALAVATGIGGFLALVALARFPRTPHKWRVVRGLAALGVVARRLMLSGRWLLLSLALGTAGFCVFSLIVFQLAWTLGVGVSLGQCLVLLPPILLVSAIPVSIAGWGLREGAVVVALGYVGVAPAAAFAISVLFGLSMAAASLPGAAFWMTSDHAARKLAPFPPDSG